MQVRTPLDSHRVFGIYLALALLFPAAFCANHFAQVRAAARGGDDTDGKAWKWVLGCSALAPDLRLAIAHHHQQHQVKTSTGASSRPPVLPGRTCRRGGAVLCLLYCVSLPPSPRPPLTDA